MGNNPSRTTAQAQPSTTSSASTSPPHRPTQHPTRRAGLRRNSLQPPPTRYSPATDPSSSLRPYPHGVPPPIRRESIAETPYASSPHTYTAPSFARTREELLADAAALRQFPAPPTRAPPTVGFSDINYSAEAPGTPRYDPVNTGLKKGGGSAESAQTMSEVDVAPDADVRAIPTLVEWPYEGNRVYLTGTFCGWTKKYRLTRQPGGRVMSAVIPITPGTHHIKFIVDGEMRTSQAIPTAVDDTGILVNYLEISTDDMPPLDRQPSPDSAEAAEAAARAGQERGVKSYTNEIPGYLRFMEEDGDGEELGREERERLPHPPSLPMMLQKVILNTSSQMKDDASVLTIPNHAVLNHLATSSIKNQVLAVSATTRYKKKYVTTLLYKAATS